MKIEIGTSLKKIKMRAVELTLAKYHGNVIHAAKVLEIEPKTVYNLVNSKKLAQIRKACG